MARWGEKKIEHARVIFVHINWDGGGPGVGVSLKVLPKKTR